MPNIFSKDPIVNVCRGLKPNSEHITKAEKLCERRALNICGQISKTQKNAMVVNEESTLVTRRAKRFGKSIYQSRKTTNNHFQY